MCSRKAEVNMRLCFHPVTLRTPKTHLHSPLIWSDEQRSSKHGGNYDAAIKGTFIRKRRERVASDIGVYSPHAHRNMSDKPANMSGNVWHRAHDDHTTFTTRLLKNGEWFRCELLSWTSCALVFTWVYFSPPFTIFVFFSWTLGAKSTRTHVLNRRWSPFVISQAFHSILNSTRRLKEQTQRFLLSSSTQAHCTAVLMSVLLLSLTLCSCDLLVIILSSSVMLTAGC